MTKSQHEALIRFNQVSQQREICDMKEKKVKRFRNIAILVFLISVLLIVAYELAVHSAFLLSINIDALAKEIPGNDYIFLILGVISFGLMLFSVLKSIGVGIRAEQARRIEGRMAQKAFALMLVKNQRN